MLSKTKGLYLLHFANDGIQAGIIALLPFIAKDLFISYSQVGVLGMSIGTLAIFMALPAGFIATKFGGIKTLLTAMLIYSLGVFFLFPSHTFLAIAFGYYLAALGFSLFHTIGFSLIAHTSDHTNLGTRMGDFSSAGDMGRVVLSSLVLFLSPQIGWRPLAGILAVLGVGISILYKLLVQDISDHEQVIVTQENNKEWMQGVVALVKDKRMLLISLTAILDTFGSNQLYIYLPFLLLAKGIHAQFLAIFTGGYFLGNFLGRLVLGRSADKFGNTISFIGAEVCMSSILFLFGLSHQIIFLFIISVGLGMLTKGTSPIIKTFFTEKVESAHYHKVFGISEVFINIAGACATLVMGMIADKFGINAILFTSATIVILAIVPLLVVKYRLSRP